MKKSEESIGEVDSCKKVDGAEGRPPYKIMVPWAGIERKSSTRHPKHVSSSQICWVEIN